VSAVAIGLSAPQGCGKTTLVELLVDAFAADGLTCAAVSIDDFYLTGAQQDAVAAEHATNPLLQVRGNAGTHDLPLGSAVLRALKRGLAGSADTGAFPGGQAAADETADGDLPALVGRDANGERQILIPRYDKAARGGRGDRAAVSTWAATGAPDVVLLEGWMAGFAPVAATSAVLQAHPGLEEVNARLVSYEAWHALMDAWVVLATDDVANVYEWRLQAERAMAASGRPGMSDAQVADFVSRYMPAYAAYLPALYKAAEELGGVRGLPTFFVRVDRTRNPVGADGASPPAAAA